MRFRAFVCFLLCATAWSQTERGGIRGTITDPTGAVVPSAKITATNVGTSVAISVNSSDSGVYNVTALQPGVYRVEVSQAGFRTMVRENVTVNAASVTGLDLTLAVGTASEVVTV